MCIQVSHALFFNLLSVVYSVLLRFVQKTRSSKRREFIKQIFRPIEHGSGLRKIKTHCFRWAVMKYSIMQWNKNSYIRLLTPEFKVEQTQNGIKL